MKMRRPITCLVSLALATSGVLRSQVPPSPAPTSELHLHLGFSQSGKHRSVPAVIWLEPLAGTLAVPFVPHGPYTLMQKNRTFLPHLQVIPVGAVVKFPNADPFFHNVFSLFDGKRFDLGLYEAGSSKSVTFSREGVSYIFCNIHPEMSAVVLALPTPLFATADSDDSFVLHTIPPGDYKLHLWIEGVPQPVVDVLTRSVHLSAGRVDLGSLTIPTKPSGSLVHTNKFGNEYDLHPKSPYDH
jgi:hypothetical protein